MSSLMSPGGRPAGPPAAILSEDPLLRSGIVLAGANQIATLGSNSEEDGVLTAIEAMGLDLHGTELVMLSACDTGIGEVSNGDGVYGLRRALVIAGARSQVASLWRLDDAATESFVSRYYSRLLKGEGRSDALRQVQLEQLKSEEYNHPYYWAAFIPIGEPGPIPTGQKVDNQAH